MSVKETGANDGARIPLSAPAMLGNEARYLAECVATNWVSSRGPFVDRFEAQLAALTGRRHAIACATGTAALHVALLVAGVEPDDEVLVSDLTFVASANAIKYCGAWPVLIDAEPVYWQMDVDKLASFITTCCTSQGGTLRNRATGRRVKAIVPVHILGHPVDIEPMIALAQQHNLRVVVDAAEALGADYRDRPAAAWGELAVLSFNGNKLVTTGGGAVLTDDDRIAERVRYLATTAKDDDVEFLHGAVGFNYRLTNIQAAVGVAQLEQLDQRLVSKRETAAYYQRHLAALPLTLPREAPWARSSWWQFTVLIDDGFGRSRPDVAARMDAARIETRPLWTPLSKQAPYRDCQAFHCEHSVDIQRRSLALPGTVGIDDDDRQRVVTAVQAAREALA